MKRKITVPPGISGTRRTQEVMAMKKMRETWGTITLGLLREFDS
jgi:hypothetical protein